MINVSLNLSCFDDAACKELNAYNAAFDELGLPWYWDASTHRQLHAYAGDGGGECVRIFLKTQQPHLLKAYDAEFLVTAINATKARYYDAAGGRGA